MLEIERDMTNVVDVWSLGVLMYWLFTKEELFIEDENLEKNIKSKPLVFKGPIWDKCSDAGKDLI